MLPFAIRIVKVYFLNVTPHVWEFSPSQVTLLGCLTVAASWLKHWTSNQNHPGLSPGRGHCVWFLGKTLYSLSVMGVTLPWTSIQGE